jgi:hypothetical protein
VPFSKAFKEAKVIMLPKPCKDPKFPQNLLLISLSVYNRQVICKSYSENNPKAPSLLGFLVHHSTRLQCMRFTDHITLIFNNNMSAAAVFLDIEKVFDTTRNLGLLYKLSNLRFSVSLIKLFSSFHPHRKCSFGQRCNNCTKGCTHWSATGFCAAPHIVQYIYI